MGTPINPMDQVKDFVEGRLLPGSFWELLCNNEDLKKVFIGIKPIPPYTSHSSGIFEYLLERDFSSLRDLVNSQNLLSKFLLEKGIPHTVSDVLLKKMDIIQKAQPKWLYLTPDYIDTLLSEAGDIKGNDLLVWLKTALQERFKCLAAPPKWLQSPNWPIVDSKPLCFIGQLDVTKLHHDKSQLYVFFNEDLKSFVTIVQSL